MGKVIDLTEKEFNFLHLLTINTRPVPRATIVAGMGETIRMPAAASTCWCIACARRRERRWGRSCRCAARMARAIVYRQGLLAWR
jgi:hypothetical protein